MKKIAVLGYGTVGSGVCRLFRRFEASLAARAGCGVSLGAVLVRGEKAPCEFSSLFTRDFSVIENDPDIAVVVEAIGGVSPAFEYAARAMRAGKAFVTSNKQLVAEKGDELWRIARENDVPFLFEAAVGGGTPLIRPLRTSLPPSGIQCVYGVLNATSNFLLTRMEGGLSYKAALAEAQAKGYAEADPADDVSGVDSCRKLAILMSMITGRKADPADIRTVGITGLTPTPAVRLIARASFGETVRAAVTPVRLPENDLLSAVTGDRNGVVFRGEGIGEAAFFGIGAGADATASAVLSDIAEALRDPHCVPDCAWTGEKLTVLPWEGDFLPEYGG